MVNFDFRIRGVLTSTHVLTGENLLKSCSDMNIFHFIISIFTKIVMVIYILSIKSLVYVN